MRRIAQAAAMSGPIFDSELMTLRLQRAQRMNGDPFLQRRAFDDCIERISAVRRPFRSALIYGRSESDWPKRLAAIGVGEVTIIAPGSGTPLPAKPDLCLSIGAFETAEPLPAILAALRATMSQDGLLIGALIGGASFPALRAAMRAADGDGPAAAHIHPRIAPAGLAALLSAAGFAMPVVDVDRVSLRYRRFDDLVRDLRGMAATNQLIDRARSPILRGGLDAARRAFSNLAQDGRTTEIVELIHFSGWNIGSRSPEN